jgi:hypothetical protein
LQTRYDVSRDEAGGKSGLLHKEIRMSREDDFLGDFHESPDDTETGQEDTSEPLMEKLPAEPLGAPPSQEPARPARPKPKPKAKKKAKTRPKAKKKVSKTTRKPAKKKTAKKKVAKKKKGARPKK